jgi:hypothetical protein
VPLIKEAIANGERFCAHAFLSLGRPVRPATEACLRP